MIRVENLTKRFGEFTAVDDLTLDILTGETFAFLGPNGSGKTTTLKCLVGLCRPTAGRIWIDGMESAKHRRELGARISYLPQRVQFQENLTAGEIINFYCSLRRLSDRRIEAAIDETRFRFNGFMDKPVGTLSGGMVQRLGLVVACLPDAEVLILDEPMVNLDPEGAVRFRQLLSELKGKGKTVVFSSHVLSDVEMLADRVAIMVGGKLVVVESVDTLRESVRRRSRMFVRFGNPSPRWTEVALEAGAEAVSANAESFTITVPEDRRLAILRAFESAGAEIAAFSTEEPTLEDIYLRYIRER